MVITETQYRQRNLDKMIQRYNDGYYTSYEVGDDADIVVFRGPKRTNCINIRGLIWDI
jgi:hypothetical protein